MTEESEKHILTDWARRRLDEMDAVLLAMEARSEALQNDASGEASGVLADMRRLRDEFDGKVKDAMAQGEAAWSTIKQQMEGVWGRYEAGLDQWVEAARNQGEAFEARSKAQMDIWQATIEDFTKRAETTRAEHREALRTEIARVEKQVEDARKNLNQAGAAGWSAMTQALKEARQAFETAAADMRKALDKASS